MVFIGGDKHKQARRMEVANGKLWHAAVKLTNDRISE